MQEMTNQANIHTQSTIHHNGASIAIPEQFSDVYVVSEFSAGFGLVTIRLTIIN